jgi:hypothetical protein
VTDDDDDDDDDDDPINDTICGKKLLSKKVCV